jgi:hypothetical protein
LCSELVLVQPDLVIDAVHRAIDRARETRTHGQARVTPVKIIEKFCHDMLPNRIATKTDTRGAKHLVVDHPPIKQPMVYELDMTANAIWIDIGELRSYMAKNGVSVQRTMDALKPWVRAPRSIGSGLSIAGPMRPVLLLPLTDPAWASLKPGSELV